MEFIGLYREERENDDKDMKFYLSVANSRMNRGSWVDDCATISDSYTHK